MRWFGYRITGITTAPIVQAPTFVCGHTNRFFQISDLPIEWRRGKEDKPYPIKQANQIDRFKTSDGKEWLASKQQWIAIDSQGNGISQSLNMV
jgi:hypothetical protein